MVFEQFHGWLSSPTSPPTSPEKADGAEKDCTGADGADAAAADDASPEKAGRSSIPEGLPPPRMGEEDIATVRALWSKQDPSSAGLDLEAFTALFRSLQERGLLETLATKLAAKNAEARASVSEWQEAAAEKKAKAKKREAAADSGAPQEEAAAAAVLDLSSARWRRTASVACSSRKRTTLVSRRRSASVPRTCVSRSCTSA